MATIDLGAAYPRLQVRSNTCDGRITGLEISVSQQPDDHARAQLVALLSQTPDLEHLFLGAGLPTTPEVDFRWALDAIRALVPNARVFLSGARMVSIESLSCRRLGTFNRITHFHGAFASVRILDLRDERVELHDSVFPDLDTLILRPRHAAWGVPWARKAIEAVDAFPAIRELRCPENDGDALLDALLASPLLSRLRCIDLTDNITNGGAQQLHAHADRLTHLEEVWIGAHHRRRQRERMNPGRDHPRGTLEIDDAWRSRLRDKLGTRLRFKPRPNHPDL